MESDSEITTNLTNNQTPGSGWSDSGALTPVAEPIRQIYARGQTDLQTRPRTFKNFHDMFLDDGSVFDDFYTALKYNTTELRRYQHDIQGSTRYDRPFYESVQLKALEDFLAALAEHSCSTAADNPLRQMLEGCGVTAEDETFPKTIRRLSAAISK